MKKLLSIALLVSAWAGFAQAQSVVNTANALQRAASAPSGACSPRGAVRVNGGTVYICHTGTATWASVSGGGGGGTGADPTATIGLTATNGVATTFMRSDAAPAINQAIVPTWTGQHTFAAGTITTSQPLTITQTWNAGGVAFTGALINITDTASATTSALFDVQRGSTSFFKVQNNFGNSRTTIGSFQISDAGSNQAVFGNNAFFVGASFTEVANGLLYIGASYGGRDLAIRRVAAANLALGTADAASPVAQALSMQNATGTNTAGASPTRIIASLGTGNAAPGALAIQGGARSATSGTTAQTAINRQIIGNSITVSNNTTTTVTNGSWTLASNTVLGGKVTYTVEVSDGTELQVETGEVALMGINKGGTFSNNTALKYGNQQAATAGTLSVTWSMTAANPSLLQVNVNSSLTPAAGFPRVTYTIINNGQQAVQ